MKPLPKNESWAWRDETKKNKGSLLGPLQTSSMLMLFLANIESEKLFALFDVEKNTNKRSKSIKSLFAKKCTTGDDEPSMTLSNRSRRP